MKIKLFIVLMLPFFHVKFFAQEYFVYDDDVVEVAEKEDQVGVEVMYYLIDTTSSKENWKLDDKIFCQGDWVIYYNKSRKDTASYSFIDNDTCVIKQYWRKEELKAIEKYLQDRLVFAEYYCENGQLIYKGNPFATDYEKVYFYCNGNIRSFHNPKNGEFKHWHENGVLSVTGILFNYKKRDLWTYYDQSGDIIKYEFYKDDDMIYSGKKLPKWYR